MCVVSAARLDFIFEHRAALPDATKLPFFLKMLVHLTYLVCGRVQPLAEFGRQRQ